jgi:hypothetical protein
MAEKGKAKARQGKAKARKDGRIKQETLQGGKA